MTFLDERPDFKEGWIYFAVHLLFVNNVIHEIKFSSKIPFVINDKTVMLFAFWKEGTHLKKWKEMDIFTAVLICIFLYNDCIVCCENSKFAIAFNTG